MTQSATLEKLTAAFPQLAHSEFRGQTHVVVPKGAFGAALHLAQAAGAASTCWSTSRASTT